MQLKPVYHFKWSDGSERSTANLENKEAAGETAIEALAAIGREDPDCTVELTGYEN